MITALQFCQGITFYTLLTFVFYNLFVGRIKTHFYNMVYNLSIIYGFLVNEVASKSDYVYKTDLLGEIDLICTYLQLNSRGQL